MSNETKEILQCKVETYKHVKAVQGYLSVFTKEFIDRSLKHDDSKFEEPELSIFAAKRTLARALLAMFPFPILTSEEARRAGI